MSIVLSLVGHSDNLPHANGFAYNPLVAGPAPAQATPDLSSTFENLPDKLKEFGNTLEDKARAAIEHIKQKEFLTKTRLGPFTAGRVLRVSVDNPTLPQWRN